MNDGEWRLADRACSGLLNGRDYKGYLWTAGAGTQTRFDDPLLADDDNLPRLWGMPSGKTIVMTMNRIRNAAEG